MAMSAQNPNSDFDVTSQSQFKDSISAVRFRPVAGQVFLNASTWDGEVRCLSLQTTGQVTTQAQQNYNTPVLCSTWTADGSAYLSGCADKVLRRWDLGSGQSIPVGQHDAPIKEVAWVSELNVAVTGSWDKTIRVWDGRTSTNVAQATMNVSERIFCMDAISSYVAAGCADNKIQIFDLRKGAQAVKVSDSPLKKQLRHLTFAGDRRCFAVASIEGRAAIEYLQDSTPTQNFAFKCHRDGNNVYAVNTMCFHPTLFSTLVTGGSDGTLSIWDKDARQRLKAFNKMASPVVSASFNHDGTLLAYATSYDWSKGAQEAGRLPTQIMVHTCNDDVKPKPKAAVGRR